LRPRRRSGAITASAESSRTENLGARSRRGPSTEQSKSAPPPPLQSPPPPPPQSSPPPLLPLHPELELLASLPLPLHPPDVELVSELPLHPPDVELVSELPLHPEELSEGAL
jgi:hypothetical protein